MSFTCSRTSWCGRRARDRSRGGRSPRQRQSPAAPTPVSRSRREMFLWPNLSPEHEQRASAGQEGEVPAPRVRSGHSGLGASVGVHHLQREVGSHVGAGVDASRLPVRGPHRVNRVLRGPAAPGAPHRAEPVNSRGAPSTRAATVRLRPSGAQAGVPWTSRASADLRARVPSTFTRSQLPRVPASNRERNPLATALQRRRTDDARLGAAPELGGHAGLELPQRVATAAGGHVEQRVASQPR